MQEYTRSLNGESIPESYRGTEIRYSGGSTIAEILSSGHAENEAAIVRAFYNQFNINGNKLIVTMANEGKTNDEIAAALGKQKLAAEAAPRGGKGNPEALAKARAAQKETKDQAAKFKALQEALAANPAQLERLRKAGIDI